MILKTLTAASLAFRSQGRCVPILKTISRLQGVPVYHGFEQHGFQLTRKMSAARGYLQPGDAAPDFSAKAAVRKDNDIAEVDIKLSDFKGKYLVLFFYPQDFTFVCPTEIIAFSDRVEEFRSIGCEVVAASTDSANCHRAWMKTPRTDGGLGEINLPLLADPTHAISKAYQVYQEEGGVAFRGLFIIDGKGVLRQITVNDLPVGRDVDETLRMIQTLQSIDEMDENLVFIVFFPDSKRFLLGLSNEVSFVSEFLMSMAKFA